MSFGSGLATGSVVANTLPLPTELGGTTVRVRDSVGTERPAPLLFISPTQVNYQIPSGTAVGVASVTITSGNVAATGTLPIRRVAPGLFSANQSGEGTAAAVALRVRADGSQTYEVVAEFDALQKRYVLHPIDLGPESDRVFLILFGTGIRFRSSLSAVVAAIGGEFVGVTFAGALPDFVGLDQVNLMLPRSLAGRGEMEASLAVDAEIANAVRVSIREGSFRLSLDCKDFKDSTGVAGA